MEGVTPSTLERWFTAPALATPGHPGVEYARRVLLAMEPEALAEAWLALAGHDVRAQLGSIATPVTVVSGNEDAATAAGALEAMAAALPGARFEAMAGPHMIHLEEPAAFATALERHLESVKEMGL